MKREDDRTPEQQQTHRWGVVALDKCMSGWGGARGGMSRCAWAVPNDNTVNIDRVFNWVRSRSEMRYVNIVDLKTYRPPRNTAHFSMERQVVD